MADQTGTTTTSLTENLQKNPYRYGFFQLMRVLECVYKEKARFGQALRPSLEPPIRVGQEVSLTFESASISAFTPRKQGLVPVLKQRFFGLFGPNGPMPLHLTEHVRDRIHYHRDHTLAGFADMFHHRLASLFYRTWANSEPVVNFDRPEQDRFSGYIGSLAGFGSKASRNRDAMPDLAKFYYTGLYANQSKPAEGLRAILADYFRLPVRIQQFTGEWLQIAENDITRLGITVRTGQLGQSAVLGSHVWTCQHKFRVHFGPLSLPAYISLLPSGQRIEQLCAVIRNYIGDELSWDVNLILKTQQVPSTQLGEHSQLGWTTWLGDRHSLKDADDLNLNPFWGKL